MVHVSLFGNQQDIIGWLRLLEQERVPYHHETDVENVSDVNILVGISPDDIILSPCRSYIFEPSLSSLSREISLGMVEKVVDEEIGTIKVHALAALMKTSEPTTGYFQLHEMYHDYHYPVLVKSKNWLKFSLNLSSQLFLQGVGFKEVPFFSDEYVVEVLTTLIDKEKILRFMRRTLIEAFHMAGIPYIHLWYYPQDMPSVFLFRQDVDYVDTAGVDNLLSVCSRYHIRGTYFVNMSGEEEFEDEIGHLNLKEPETPKRVHYLEKIKNAGNEIGNHGYWHYVFETCEENDANMKRCDNLLKELLSVSAKGFSAPGGTWHVELGRAIEQNGFEYASNSSLDSGGFPYYPYVGREKSTSLEIPVALVCLSILDNLEIEIGQFVQYYLTYIDRQVEHNEPISILGHPHLMGKVAQELLPPAFEKIANLHIPNMVLGEFADWWKKREKIGFNYELKEQEIEITSESSDFYVEIIYNGRKELKKVDKTLRIPRRIESGF